MSTYQQGWDDCLTNVFEVLDTAMTNPSTSLIPPRMVVQIIKASLVEPA
jgi:hypothetical protein